MTGLFIVLIVLLFFVFLFTVPVHVTVMADEDVRVWLRVLLIRIPIFPASRKKRAKKKKQQRKKESGKQKAKKKPETGKKNILHMIRLVARIASVVMKKLSRHLRIRLQAYEISVATGDAAKTAVLYGAVAGLSSNFIEVLRNTMNFKVKKSAPVGVYADFVGEKTRAKIKIDFSINLWGALATLLVAGIAFVKNKSRMTEH